ncbi:MAG: hypothetical protein ACM3ML_10325 [Micromonosporaceae bacterium]
MPPHLEVPRPWRLLRTAAWNLNEAAGLPLVAYLFASWLFGRAAGLLSGLAIVWIVTAVHKVRNGTVPGLLMISVTMMTVQTGLALATGQVWIYFLQVPVAKLGLSLIFARSARTSQPLVGRLATEVVALRHPAVHHPGLHRYFQRATWLWAGIFMVLAVGLAVFVATQSAAMFILISSTVTPGLILIGAAVSALWFFSVIRRLGLRLRFAAA